MAEKLIVIGIDGLDPELITKWVDQLPNIRNLIAKGVFRHIDSVFPPDSIPAWASIYTGQDPSQHGIIDSINYLDKKKFENISIDQTALTGKTFWDKLSQRGKKVCVINPFICYPAWEVNGIMVSGPSLDEGAPSIFGELPANAQDVPHLGGIPHFPSKNELEEFIRFNQENTHDIEEFGRKLYAHAEWDLFFIYFLTLDRIKHFLWRYHDCHDPSYPGENQFQGSILEFYRQYDTLIGNYIAAARPDTRVLIISDHGHQRRCTKVFNINEFLRQRHWLVLPDKEKGIWIKIVIEKLKGAVLNAMDKYNCQDLVFRFVRLIPNRQALKKSNYIIDKKHSLCFASEFCSTNPAGGLEINDAQITERGIDKSSFIDSLMTALREVTDPETSEPIFEWVMPRQALFAGEKLNCFPEIVFCLKDEYGVNWSLFTDMIGGNVTHKKISGGHRKKAVFLFDQPDIDCPDCIAGIHDFIVSQFPI